MFRCFVVSARPIEKYLIFVSRLGTSTYQCLLNITEGMIPNPLILSFATFNVVIIAYLLPFQGILIASSFTSSIGLPLNINLSHIVDVHMQTVVGYVKKIVLFKKQ